MNPIYKISCLLLLFIFFLAPANAQKEYTDAEIEKSGKLFDEGNSFMEAKKYPEALAKYEAGLAITPDSIGLLYNGGLAAFTLKKFDQALRYWIDVKKGDPEDWQVRAKLIQAYQALDKIKERDSERSELFALRKNGKIADLVSAEFYCREQTEIGSKKIMIFEHFELKDPRALKYVFYILDGNGEEEYRISLGSYATTVAIWREMTKPKPKDDERLFHLDGYYKWGHATFGMYGKEPSYDETREMVKKILEKEKKPVSSSTIVNAPKEGKKP